MNAALPRLRSFRRAKPLRLWWFAVGVALRANLAVIVGLSQVSRLHSAVIEPPLLTRTMRRQPVDPPPPAQPTPSPAQEVAAQPQAIALPSLDLPEIAPPSALALPALPPLDRELVLPALVPAFAAIVPPGAVAEAAFGTLAGDQPAEILSAFLPEQFYPRAAKRRGQTGTSRVRLSIDATGAVTRIEVLSSTPAGVFDEAAEQLARSVRCRPATRDGKPVASQRETVIQWTLK